MPGLSHARRLLRPRNIALGLAVAAPGIYWLAFATNADGSPRQARYWQVKAYELVPLRLASRLWGSFNAITLPEWFRPYGYRFYAWMFGANLSEMADENLKNYANLGDFFYRQLKPDARPIAASLIVSPSDGKVLQCGQLTGEISQVKGFSYSLDRLLGSNDGQYAKAAISEVPAAEEGETNLARDEKFGELNGISYTVSSLIKGKSGPDTPVKVEKQGDAADQRKSIAQTTRSLAQAPPWAASGAPENHLYYCVIYLAPGDYHRFHSPVPWVVSLRRHFSGELFSVAPYFQERMRDLFCLNERVALLGRWRHGFFSMTPVGATNVGSIVIDFDKQLKTNTRGSKPNTCEEASYMSASALLGGFPLNKGEQMGGFRLGSTVVLVFEAPPSFKFSVKQGAVVKMGEELGHIEATNK